MYNISIQCENCDGTDEVSFYPDHTLPMRPCISCLGTVHITKITEYNE